MAKKRILLTGAAGRIGKCLAHALGIDYELVLLDIKNEDGIFNVDLLDLDRQLPFYKNVDVVIHLAANSAVSQSWDDVVDKTINITQRVFEACRLTGVKKIIFASTNHVMGNYYSDYDGNLITENMEVRPDSYYATGKILGENLGRFYSEVYGVNCICLRIGAFSVEVPGDDLGKRIWISDRDLIQIVRKCIEFDMKFEIFNAVSDNINNYFSLAKSKRVLGYNPFDGVKSKKSNVLGKIARKVNWLLKDGGHGLRLSVSQRLSRAELVSDCRCIVGEQPVWNAVNHELYWLDMGAGKVYCYNYESGKSRILCESDGIGGMTLQESGELIVFQNDGNIFGIDNGKTRKIGRIQLKNKFRFNDAIADPLGRVICGTVGINGDNGSLYLVEQNGKVRKILDNTEFSNGMGFSNDGAFFYHTDSKKGIIFKYKYDSESGILGKGNIFVKIPKTIGVPDGLAVDSQGFVWTCIWDGRCVIRCDPAGKNLKKFYLPVKKVTSCAFGGRNLDELYITSAGGDQIEQNGKLAGGLFKLRVSVVGKKSYFSKL